jgi:hypothetical protein
MKRNGFREPMRPPSWMHLLRGCLPQRHERSSSSEALVGIEDDLAAVGVERTPGYWGGWEERLRVLEESDHMLAERGLLAEVREREQPGSPPAVEQGASPEREARLDVWREVVSNPTPELSVTFLRLLMTDREPVASAAAAVALSRWQQTRGFAPPDTLVRAKELTRLNLESSVPLARDIARAAVGQSSAESPQKQSRRGRMRSLSVAHRCPR